MKKLIAGLLVILCVVWTYCFFFSDREAVTQEAGSGKVFEETVSETVAPSVPESAAFSNAHEDSAFVQDVVEPELNSDEKNLLEKTRELLSHQKPTHWVVRDGDWSDPSIWANGVLPEAGAHVRIAEGVSVVLDFENDAHLASLHLEGTLMFATAEDTALKVHTLLVDETGVLQVGSVEAPVEAGYEALLSISALEAEDGAFVSDPILLSLGKVNMQGQAKTSMLPLAQSPSPYDQAIVLETVPQGWQAGDVVVIAGARLGRESEETLLIEAIEGQTVHLQHGDPTVDWSGLPEDTGADNRLKGFAINVSRNVGIASDTAGGTANPGRVVIAGESAELSLGHVGAYGLGIDDANQLDEPLQGASSAPAFSFEQADATTQHTLNGLALVDIPEMWLETKGPGPVVENSVAYDYEGGAWLTPNGSQSRLLWKQQRRSLVMQ